MEPASSPDLPHLWLCSSQTDGGPWPAVLVSNDTALVSTSLAVLREPPSDLHLALMEDQQDAPPTRWMVAYAAVIQVDNSRPDDLEAQPALGAVRLFQPIDISIEPVDSDVLERVLQDNRGSFWRSFHAAGLVPADEPEEIQPPDILRRPHAIPVTEAGIPVTEAGVSIGRGLFCLLFPDKCLPVELIEVEGLRSTSGIRRPMPFSTGPSG